MALESPLVTLLRKNGPSIIVDWARQLRGLTDSAYASRALEELLETTRECFEGYLEVLDTGNYVRLRRFIERIARLRAPMGFRVSEVQRAFYAFKPLAWPLVLREFSASPEALTDAAQQLDHCVAFALFEFSEEFHRDVIRQVEHQSHRVEDLKRERDSLNVVDPLTGLFTRRYFHESLDREVQRVNRYGRALATILFDIDRFRALNDSYGQAAGDEVLRATAQTLQRLFRRVDTVARYGGEEFAVLLPETAVEGAERAAERLRVAIAYRPVTLSAGGTVSMTVSGAVASGFTAPVRTEEVMGTAEEGVRSAKALGRNRIVVVGAR